MKANIKMLLGLNKISDQAKYLGNPLFMGRKITQAYEDLKRKIEFKLQGWKSKLLSQARKSTLIKSVINVMLVYAMSNTSLPLKWCQDVERLTSKFLWNNQDRDRHLVPIA